MPKFRNTKIMKTQLMYKSYETQLMFISVCQRYGPGVPTPPIYVAIAKLSAQQPLRGRPTRADAID